MIDLTEAQRQAVKKGEAVRLIDPESGEELVLLAAAAYEALRERREDEQEKAAWAKLARKAADRWAQENPF
jgi:hypothetical protein